MIAKSRDDRGKLVAIARGTAVRANTDTIRRLNGRGIWRVVDIDEYNIILKSTKPDEERTLYFGPQTFLTYWKIAKEKATGEKPLIGDRVMPQDIAVMRYFPGGATFRVVGVDDGYIILEQEGTSRRGKPKTEEWLASNFWVCFARAT